MKARLSAVLALVTLLCVFCPSIAAAQAQITVTAANPSAAPPGSIALTVAVSGNGFKHNAKVTFLVSGTTSTGDVSVTGTTLVSSSQVNATINVASTATDASYDVVVTNTDGSSGKGTELFAVNKNANPDGSINVTATVYDLDSSNNLLLLRSDDRNAAQQATYTVGDAGVISEISPGLSDLNLNGQTGRSVYLTFSSPAGNSGPAPLPDGYYNARVMSRCFDANNNIVSMYAIAPGTTNNRCSLRVGKIYHNNIEYFFVMTPDGQYPGTGWANVTCTAGDSSGCIAWHIEPNLDSADFPGNIPTVAQLYSISTHANKQTLIGSYHNTYRIDLHE